MLHYFVLTSRPTATLVVALIDGVASLEEHVTKTAFLFSGGRIRKAHGLPALIRR